MRPNHQLAVMSSALTLSPTGAHYHLLHQVFWPRQEVDSLYTEAQEAEISAVLALNGNAAEIARLGFELKDSLVEMQKAWSALSHYGVGTLDTDGLRNAKATYEGWGARLASIQDAIARLQG